MGEDSEKAFIHLFGTILKLRNLLSSFDQFEAADPLSERDLQDYTSIYLDLADTYRREGREKEFMKFAGSLFPSQHRAPFFPARDRGSDFIVRSMISAALRPFGRQIRGKI